MSSIEINQRMDWLQGTYEKLSHYKDKLTVKNVADILGCGKEAIRKRIISGKLQSIRIGRTDYVAKEWLLSYIQNGGGLRHNLRDNKCKTIISYCIIPRSREEIRQYIGYSTKPYTLLILRELMAAGLLKQTERSHSNNQKYIAITPHV